MSTRRSYDIYDRCFQFSFKTGVYLKRIKYDFILQNYMKQLVRSSSSVSANLNEADCALTKKDFVHKVGISRKEAKESWNWLKLIQSVGEFHNDKDLQFLIKESEEIVLILSKIIHSVKR